MTNFKYNDFDDSVKCYFNSLKSFKPLKKKEERALLEDYLKRGNVNARNTLINSNLKYACALANTYRGKGVEFSDLISEANSGLIESIDKYDLSKNVKLITYAKWWILQRLNNCINNNYKILTDELPSDHEKQNDVDDDDAINNGTVNEYEKIVVDEIDNDTHTMEMKYYLNDILNVLSERERDIIEMYYGINGSYYNLEDIGEQYGITKERARQIIEKSLIKLRSKAMLMPKSEIA